MYPDALGIIGEWSEKRYHVVHANNLDLMRSLPNNCIDSCVCDPPAGISFMGKKWDSDKGGCGHWIDWLTKTMSELYRILKPGAHAFVWALPRTSHWTGAALENAGFEIRDCKVHLFSSGMPKGINVSKTIDKHLGAERKVVGSRRIGGNAGVSSKEKGGTYGVGVGTAPAIDIPLTVAGSEEAAEYEGYGTGLKPAAEFWWLVRKPLEGTVAENVLKYGTGGINVDGCRVATDWNESDRPDSWKQSGHSSDANADKIAAPPGNGINCHPEGRWPANASFEHADDCRLIGHKTIKAPVINTWDDGAKPFGDGAGHPYTSRQTTEDGTETIPIYDCVDGCPVKLLEQQSGITKSGKMKAGTKREGIGYCGGWGDTVKNDTIGDEGTAARFFTVIDPEEMDPFIYLSKPSRAEKEVGCEHLPVKTRNELSGRKEGSAGQNNPMAGVRRKKGMHNHHATVKRVKHMQQLVKLITPPNGIVIDIFCGSGSTISGAVSEGFRAIGVDMDHEFVAISRARAEWWQKHPGGLTEHAKKESKAALAGQLSIDI